MDRVCSEFHGDRVQCSVLRSSGSVEVTLIVSVKPVSITVTNVLL